MIGNSPLFEQKEVKRCPYCNASSYEEMYTMTTLASYPPIYKDGVNINPDKNTITAKCHCKNCNKIFKIVNGEVKK